MESRHRLAEVARRGAAGDQRKAGAQRQNPVQ
jgi:hypothetical protein